MGPRGAAKGEPASPSVAGARVRCRSVSMSEEHLSDP